MSSQTVGRSPQQRFDEPISERAGLPINAQYYHGQLLVQDGAAGGAFRPYVQGLTGSVVIGINDGYDISITAAVSARAAGSAT